MKPNRYYQGFQECAKQVRRYVDGKAPEIQEEPIQKFTNHLNGQMMYRHAKHAQECGDAIALIPEKHLKQATDVRDFELNSSYQHEGPGTSLVRMRPNPEFKMPLSSNNSLQAHVHLENTLQTEESNFGKLVIMKQSCQMQDSDSLQISESEGAANLLDLSKNRGVNDALEYQNCRTPEENENIQIHQSPESVWRPW